VTKELPLNVGTQRPEDPSDRWPGQSRFLGGTRHNVEHRMTRLRHATLVHAQVLSFGTLVHHGLILIQLNVIAHNEMLGALLPHNETSESIVVDKYSKVISLLHITDIVRALTCGTIHCHPNARF